ncbi:beta-L-arabinofuranosidase domain-containing protein [Fibrella forsythiae]|uniref:Glycoside hydrolase family 127 protein n=1 Tax=Fibrella forsythiae TaxID=2817061 RepID=A0ABS3JIE7_9BACT|nr:beta-L-arabinofuranosidase domain-containing protein [Fibrella forsythiae]MBO0949778.1 glycoside hydrolase family 127 protein [Fibrella forsythiae]
MRALSFAVLAVLLAGTLNAQAVKTASARPPLAPLRYVELPLGAIKPQGWLRTQLEVMRDGTTGHLDEYYWKLKNDNGWLGGKGDGWEETPYWLDGAVPLAHLIDDKPLTDKVQRYIDWSISSQRKSGYFGPVTKTERDGKPMTACDQGEDWWPRMVMLKVMQQHYQATGDKRVIPFMTKYLRYQYDNLKTCPLGKWSEWSTARGGDNLMSVYWLYNQTGETFLLELGKLISQQTTPWTQYFGGRNWVMQAAAQQNGTAWMDRHAVNVGMGLKLPAVQYLGNRDPKLLQTLKTGWNDLMLLHGLPHGMFSGDEDLHGNDPTQGIELCAIVETMFSLEQAISITGDPAYMDALERMTFNAMPTQTTDDYNNRQYFQVANQVEVSRGVFDFSLPFDRGMNNVFGPYAGYTCCTVNMHQGWTKFSTHLWYSTGTGLAALTYAPNTLTTKLPGGSTVTIREETGYPFTDQIQFTIDVPRAVAFPLDLRIPGWCKLASLLLNGKPLRTDKGGQIITLQRTWQPGDILTLQLPMTVTTSNWAKNSRSVERGPLVYALHVPAATSTHELKEEGTYVELKPKGDWNFGLPQSLVKDPVANTTVTLKNPAGFVWNAGNAPVVITTRGRKIPGWKATNGVAHQPVSARDGFYKGEVSDKEETLTLIPYGCSKLRIVAFPVVR